MFAGMEHITESLLDALVQHQKERGVVSVGESDLEGEVASFQPADDFQRAVLGIKQHIYPIFTMLHEDIGQAVSALKKGHKLCLQRVPLRQGGGRHALPLFLFCG
jgi:hypothetical protein